MQFLRTVVGIALLMAVRAEPGTRGRTDGEPGNDVAAHCCGMKGLGGATVDVLCHPDQIALGQDFTVNVKYSVDIPRPVDIKVDVLNAQTKQYYAGKTIQMNDQAGQVSLTIRMADWAQEPFLWKVFVAPRGEPFPNMLAETGFVAHLGPNVVSQCYPIETKALPVEQKNVDYVILRSVPAVIAPGQTVPVVVEYNLVSAADATISAAVMRKGPNMGISDNVIQATQGRNQATINVQMPYNVNKEPIYVVSTLTPQGKDWNDRLAEDRTYNVKFAGTRMLRVNPSGEEIVEEVDYTYA